jgi:hypothetical protein
MSMEKDIRVVRNVLLVWIISIAVLFAWGIGAWLWALHKQRLAAEKAAEKTTTIGKATAGKVALSVVKK